MSQLERVGSIALGYPEAVRHDIEAWEGEPTFRVRGKNFVFAHPDGLSITVKLPKEEAAAVVDGDVRVTPSRYGLGRHGWITVTLTELSEDDWEEIEEWIDSSYRLVAPRRLVAQLNEAAAG